MRTKTLIAVTLTIAGSLASPAYADVLVGGKIVAVYADPSDVVIQLNHTGDCSPFGGPNPSSVFFHFQRAQTNFKELTALALNVRELKALKLWNDAEISVTFVMRGLVDREGRPLPVSPGVRARFDNVKVAAVTPQ